MKTVGWTIKETSAMCVRNLLLIVPFTASTTNAMEMNRAMTSSVDLEKQQHYRSDNQGRCSTVHIKYKVRCYKTETEMKTNLSTFTFGYAV